MKKLFSIVTISTLSMLFSIQAFAHSYLSGSNPTDGEVKTEQVQEITLNFDGEIMEGSFLDISTKNGDPIEVTNIENGDGYLAGKVAEPLTNNEYKVNWSIISADGHPLEGNFSFTVNAPVTEPNEEANEEQQSESNSGGEDNISNEIAQVDDEGSKSLIFVILAIAAIVLIVSLAFLIKRKKQ